jgi:anti-anti-sigma factor
MEKMIPIEEELKGDVLILRIKGKLDSILSPSLEKKAIELINTGQNKLLLDLGEVSYISSAGLRMLLSVKKQFKALAGRFVVCALTPEVLEIMKICGFDHVLEIAKTEEEALRQF